MGPSKATKKTRSKVQTRTSSKRATVGENEKDKEVADEKEYDGRMKKRCLKVSSKLNVTQVLNYYMLGLTKRSQFQKSIVPPIMSFTSQFRVFKQVQPFDRRVTALAWHPSYTGMCAAGSKGGDLVLWDTSKQEGNMVQHMIKGRGPGGSVQSLILDEKNADRFYTACIDGQVATQLYGDKEGTRKKVFLETNDWERWYTGLDISFSSNILVAGNNRGMVSLLSLEGEKVWDLKLHKTKCNFVQFSRRQPWMMVTSSVDHMVKVWDIRMISSKESAIAVLPHDKPVNSAYFSPMCGDKLLTTDQHSQVRVYQAPTFHLVNTIPHPHRQFQHLTPIKATWHPLADIIVVGRYPDPKFPSYTDGELRSIDFFCGDSGDSLYQLHQPGLNMIMSLVQFNHSGDLMLASMGQTLLLWRAKLGIEDGEALDSLGQVEEWPDFKSKGGKKKRQSKDEK